jgi:hypothetical protein
MKNVLPSCILCTVSAVKTAGAAVVESRQHYPHYKTYGMYTEFGGRLVSSSKWMQNVISGVEKVMSWQQCSNVQAQVYAELAV